MDALNHNEASSAGGTPQSAILNPVFAAEPAEAHGFYKTCLTGPVEQFRERYVELRDRLTRKGIAGFLDRLMNGARITAEFLAIPIEQKWEDRFENVVCTVGKNLALDTYLAGSGYTVTGPFVGLINTNASAAVVGDTMSSHSGWLEVGNANAPTYTSPRKTAAWSAASSGSKALSSALSFAITSSGTVGGCFLVFGSGAVSTIDNTSGTLYSAGAFSGGSKTVSNGDTLSVSYTASL
jgi:hypothetical protein